MIGTIRRIDWDVLKSLDLDSDILELIYHNGWDKLFSINEPTYKELTLEVLSKVEIAKHCPFTRQPSSISFRAFGNHHRVTQDQLGVLMGLYPKSYTCTFEFQDLTFDFPYSLMSATYWSSIATCSITKKAFQLRNPAQRYIQHC